MSTFATTNSTTLKKLKIASSFHFGSKGGAVAPTIVA